MVPPMRRVFAPASLLAGAVLSAALRVRDLPHPRAAEHAGAAVQHGCFRIADQRRINLVLVVFFDDARTAGDRPVMLKEVFDGDGSAVAAEGLRRIAEFYEIEADIHRHGDGLQTFLHDGRVEIDSNSVENQIRPIALNRKNALFAGHDEGGRAWGRIASLIETAMINGVEPFAYLKATLEAIAAGHRQGRIDDAPTVELQAVKLNPSGMQPPLTMVEVWAQLLDPGQGVADGLG